MLSGFNLSKFAAVFTAAALFSYTQPAAGKGISSPAGLRDIAADLSGSYHLEKDIDLSGEDFQPLGSPDTPFTGTFDGNGYQVRNLSVQHGDYTGLFGCVGEDGVIINLALTDARVEGKDATGALAGLNMGAIVDSFAVAFVSGGEGTGGLAGVNEGAILESYSMGSVSGVAGTGGAAGINRGSITDSYARSSVSGGEMTGGFAGYNSGDISRSYSTGYTTGAVESTGGFCGLSTGMISGSFWDIQSSGRANSDGGSGSYTPEMQTMELFKDEGWDFSKTWNRNSAYNSGYPFLRWRWDAAAEQDPAEDESGPEPEPPPGPKNSPRLRPLLAERMKPRSGMNMILSVLSPPPLTGPFLRPK